MNPREVVELEAQLHRAKAWERLGNVYTDDIEFVAADGTKIVGRDRVVDLLRREDQAFPNGSFTHNVVAVDGPIVVINWIWTGTHDKDFLTASGQTVPPPGERSPSTPSPSSRSTTIESHGRGATTTASAYSPNSACCPPQRHRP